ncbi:hypothetical protein FLONG3_3220 [Fusarium longipes]|uniref:Uncharacterized protein n=1 Tax=Fusarium longipes TaxID=694270 RepID=A0A395T1S2_9HYPO|nr:hypothetical protein FLONG3_3220 [Fusarium longipes]
MRLDREENPPEGTRDFRFDPDNLRERSGVFLFDEEAGDLGDIIEYRGTGLRVAPPRRRTESVHYSVIAELFPDNFEALAMNGRLSFPHVPREAKMILIHFLYTGNLKKPEDLSEMMTDQQVRDLVVEKIQEEYPERYPEWYESFIDRMIAKRCADMLEGRQVIAAAIAATTGSDTAATAGSGTASDTAATTAATAAAPTYTIAATTAGPVDQTWTLPTAEEDE